MKKFSLLFFLSALSLSLSALGIKHPKAQNTVKFTENKSQWENRILYRADLDGGALFLEKNCFTYNFYDKQTLHDNHIRKEHVQGQRTNDQIRSHAFRLTFLNAAPSVISTGKDLSQDYSNFFIGKDKSKWVGHANIYHQVYYSGLYQGIDLQVLGMENSMKYNFIVSPNSSSSVIKLFYEGLDEISLSKGNLKMKTSLNEIIEEKPVAYQYINGQKTDVPCRFVLKGTTVSFSFPKGYNKNLELVIDPVLVFACSSGSTADNFGMTATFDDAGDLFGGGTIFGVGYPVTLGVYDPTWNGSGPPTFGRTDVVITKYDSSGTYLQYSTYFGGSVSTEVVSSLIVNSQNELMLFGATGSSDFPVTPNAFDTTFSGGDSLVFGANGTQYNNGTDLYVAKFSADGSTLLASTFVGGSENEGTNNSNTLVFNYGDYYRGEIQVDNLGNCYVASCTYSSDFPTTAGCVQPTFGGGMDGVLFKMDPLLTSMVWSTYIGGNQDDGCYALTLDNQSNVYTTGGTSSTNFASSPGAYQNTYNGGITDGYIVKVKNDGSAIMNATFIGTPVYDQTFLIQLDNTNNVYVIGQSQGTMPVSAGAYSNPNSQQFIWKMDSNLSTLLVSTLFGNGNGQVNISPAAFLVDICGNIYVCGWGGNILQSIPTSGMPVTANAFQSSTDGYNFYLFVLKPDATALLYATYFGGAQSREHVDGGTSRFDKKGVVYQAVCAGCGGHDDFPVTPGSWPYTSPSYTPHTNGVPSSGINMSTNCNMGVFKFDFQAAGVSANAVISPNDTICPGDQVNFNNTSSHAYTYIWDFGDGSPQSNLASPNHSYPSPGTYNVSLIAIDSNGCLFSDTSHLAIVVAPFPVVDIGNDTVVCQQPNITLDAGTSGNIYTWSTGAATETITATSPGNYWVQVSNGHCRVSDTLNIQQITLAPFLGNDTALCAGQTLQLDPHQGASVSYLWSTGDTTSSIIVGSAGPYWVTVASGPCSKSDTIVVSYHPYPVINLPASVIICPNDSVTLNGGSPATSYLWSTSDTTQNITVSTAGTYSVTANNYQCAVTASVIATQITLPHLGKDTSLCAGQTITLEAEYPGATYLWSTGAVSSSITVSTAGVYWVKVSFAGCVQSDTMAVNYIPYPVVNLVPNITICEGDSVLLDAGNTATTYQWSTGDTTQTIYASSTGTYIVEASNRQCATTDATNLFEITFSPLPEDTILCNGQSIILDASVAGASYTWSTGSTAPSITASSPGQYWVTTTMSFCQKKDTINIGYVPYPVISLPSTLDLCPNTIQLLDPGNSASAYLWSNGDTTQTINVSAGGTYYVAASNHQCTVYDTTKINAIKPVSWNRTETICGVNEYTLDAGVSALTYLWSTGETTPTITITEAGTYWVIARTATCVLGDTVIIDGSLASGVLWFPNSFTPNDNGLNDKFTGKGTDITYFDLMIFDRWGELIYETEKQDQGWDGYYKGKLVEQDVYVWKVKYKTKCDNNLMKSQIGHVTLVR